MRGRSDAGHVDDYVDKFDTLRSYQTAFLIKESRQERTELVCNEAGKRLIRKTIVLACDAKAHPYELLEGHSCPYLPKIELALRIGDELVVLMEAIEGETLRQRVAKRGPVSPEAALSMFAGVVRGLEFLHGSLDTPIVHRDIKPDNIIVLPNGAARLIDFGIARLWNCKAQSDTVMMGTQGYAAPEQFGFAQTDVRTDVYALGMTVRFALTGRDPREEGKTGIGSIDEVISRACAFDPDDRYTWVVDFYADLKAAVRQCASGSRESIHDASAPDAARAGGDAGHDGSDAAQPVNPSSPPKAEGSTAKPGCGWRCVQMWSFLFGLGFIATGFRFLLGWETSKNPVGTFALAVLVFGLPLLVLSDPYDVLRKRGFFDIGSGRRLLRLMGIGFAISAAVILTESLIASGSTVTF